CIAGLSTRGYNALLCCNVLEHVVDPRAICAKLESIISARGFLLVTVPNRFPYHPDPVDTMFRPEVADVVGLFPHSRLLDGVVIDCGTGWDYVDRDPGVLVSKLRRRLASRDQHGGLKGTTSFLPWLFRTFRQACVLLQRGELEG